ncbi:TetR family transcriptional regulator [Kribbella amoyensis]|uniref:TetR family transcriptional regulator n=1 Tax=Kribbella amoyensis TaxID=996641 RepID=A0A561B2Y6_9ACTN|nr:TetR/AcrR family transcriptional regulator C-terminal domain-containing protein [Kribbella amoyensis]TWD73228.1 TetR family transcriptional regulator [Kribbella amoyensis]
MTDSIWTRRRTAPPPREGLSATQIVRTAIEVLDAEGLAGLSMRKLGSRLGAGATSLYWHVQTKDDLLELVIDEIFGEVDVPEPELAGWRPGAVLFAHSLRHTVLRHPWLPEVIYTRPSIGPNAVALGSRGLALFAAAGFTGLAIDYAMGSVMSYVFGRTNPEAVWRETMRRSGKTTEQWVDDVLADALPASADSPEMQESIQRRRVDQDQLQADAFMFGLDCLLDGLEARLRTEA